MSTVRQIGLRSPAQARRWLQENGITMTEFARRYGLSRTAVVDVLSGRNKGSLGKAHAAAVALGIKPPPRQPLPPRWPAGAVSPLEASTPTGDAA